MSLTEEVIKYGEVLFQYEGNGTIYSNQNKEYKCKFCACQFENGEIVIGFSIENEHFPIQLLFNDDFELDYFTGRTSDRELTIKSEGSFSKMRFNPDMPENFVGSWELFHVQKLNVYNNNDKNKNLNYIFGITNFEFDKLSNKEQTLNINNELKVKLIKSSRYSDKIEKIKEEL